MSYETHLCFDVETLGVYENAVVLSIACVPFEFETPVTSVKHFIDNSFYCKLNVEEQIRKFKREVDKDTVAWWKKQSKDVFEENCMKSDEDVSVAEAIAQLESFIKQTSYDWKTGSSWSRGNYFDFPKIESLCRNVGRPTPFNTWKLRDIRTMIDVLTGSDNGSYQLTKSYDVKLRKHNCLHDCIIDVLTMKEIFSELSDAF